MGRIEWYSKYFTHTCTVHDMIRHLNERTWAQLQMPSLRTLMPNIFHCTFSIDSCSASACNVLTGGNCCTDHCEFCPQSEYKVSNAELSLLQNMIVLLNFQNMLMINAAAARQTEYEKCFPLTKRKCSILSF